MQGFQIETSSGANAMSYDVNEQLAEAAKRIYKEYGGNLQCFFHQVLAEDDSQKLAESLDPDALKRTLSHKQNASESRTARKP
jgi:hypothetical protein